MAEKDPAAPAARPAPPRPAEAPAAPAVAPPPVSTHWKRKDHGEGDGHESERWLLPYADFITLLMVLFMTLYALQLVKAKDVAAKMQESQVQQQADAQAGGEPPPQQDPRLEELIEALKEFRDAGLIKLTQDARGVEIQVNAKLLFHSGDARLLPQANEVLKEIVKVLKNYPSQDILVEGHTDSVPISTAKYESNWELSSARAGSVVRFMVDQGIESLRLSAMGRADNVPAALGTDPESLAANRRVTILLMGAVPARKGEKL